MPKGKWKKFTRRQKVGFARRMRRAPTAGEEALYRAIKRHLPKVRVMRQVIVKGFILDIYVPSKRLCIEVDGSIHSLPGVKAKDQIRDSVLNGHGISVFRVPNIAAIMEPDKVAEKVVKLMN